VDQLRDNFVTTLAVRCRIRHRRSMGTSHRIEAVGAVYHVVTKAVAGVMAFPDFRHRSVFMTMFQFELVASDWDCLGYAVVGTHYHVIVRINKLTLSSGFRRLNSRYARWFNRDHTRTGALWQRRFYDASVETDAHLIELQRYLAYNAPRANLADAPEDWPFCNYGSLIGVHPSDPYVKEDEILAVFGSDIRRARKRLREFVEERDPRVRRRLTLPRRASDAEK
jgi:putative transposase